MNSDNQLLVGIIMMSLGGFVALLAFTILREQQKAAKKKAKGEAESQRSSDADAEQDEPPAEKEAEDTQEKVDRETIAASFRKMKAWVLGQEQAEETAEPREEVDEKPEGEEPEEEEPHVVDDVPLMRKRISVFTLLRDEEKGNIIVQVGDHEYHSSQDLFDSPDWNRVEYAAVDLSAWLRRAQDQEAKMESAAVPERKPLSMVEQINHFLQRNLEEIESEKRRIKLYEGPDETVHVLIDNNSYAIDEVPDPDVSKLIREAVSEWEALQ